MGLGENFFWGSDQTTGTTGTTGPGWLSLFWLFRTACYLNSAPRWPWWPWQWQAHPSCTAHTAQHECIAHINRPPTGGDLAFSWKKGHI